MANKYLKLLKEFITDKNKRFLILNSLCFYKNMDDEEYLKRRFYAKFGRYPDLKDPKTYNEKLQWLKLHDFKPLYTKIADKYEVKKYVADLIGQEYIIPTLKVYDCLDDIRFDELPDSFVIKVTHDSGGLYVVKDKSKVKLSQIKRKLSWRFKRNFYYVGREKPYRDIKPRIIAEKYMNELSGEDLIDYRFFCFDGEPKLIIMTHNTMNKSKLAIRMYDTDWNLLNVGFKGKPPIKDPEPRPQKLEELLRLSRILSRPFKHIRADFYVVGDKIYFGELTFFHVDGLEVYTPESFEYEMGALLDLSDMMEKDPLSGGETGNG